MVRSDAFGWDRHHALDEVGVFGMAQRREGEQRVHRGESGIAGPCAVAAFAFEVIEEPADPGRVEVVEVQRVNGLPGGVVNVAEQQPEGVPVGGDGVPARPPLSDQPVGEERLQRGGERGHDGSPKVASNRAAASVSSSGAADRYQ